MFGSFHRYVGNWLARRTGPDIFISYSRTDTGSYAMNLAAKLAAMDFTCYVDQWGSAPGKAIPINVIRALRRSRLFVLCATAGAAASAAVHQEVMEFLSTGRPIVPVDFGGTWKLAKWADQIAGIARTEEPLNALTSGIPSPATVTRIAGAYTFNRRNAVVRRDLTALAIGIACAAAVAIYLGFDARQQQRAAEERLREVRAQNAATMATALLDRPRSFRFGGARSIGSRTGIG